MDDSRVLWVGGALIAAIAGIAVVVIAGNNDTGNAEDGSQAPTSTSVDRQSTTPAEQSTTTELEASTTTQATTTTETGPGPVVELQFDFDDDAEGWEPGFADLPADDQDFFELVGEWQRLPEELGSGGALFSSGQNRSDDLIMYWIHEIGDLTASTPYLVETVMVLGTNQPSGLVGIGGSPTVSVFVKAGGSAAKPEIVVDDLGFERLTVDIGTQSQDGQNARVIGDIDNPDVDREVQPPAPYAPLALDGTGTGVTVISDAEGRLWLLVGIDSGFEGLTSIYFDQIQIKLTPRS